MDTYDEKIQNAIIQVEEKDLNALSITLSNGAVLRLKKFPFMRIQAVVSQFKYPDIPEVYDEMRGKPIKNPDSPTYLAMKMEVDQDRSMAVMDAVATFGVEVEYLPEDVPALEDDSWIEELEFIHIPVQKDSRLARYQAWIKFVVIRDPVDFAKVAEEFGIQMGTAERKIADNLQNHFPDHPVR
jgi:hypothetical protein